MDLTRIALAVMPALGSIVGASISSGQPSSKVPRLAYLPSVGTAAGTNPSLQALRQGLAELGYVDGRNIVVEARGPEGRIERLPQLAAEIVGLDVDVIVTLGGVATRAAKNATSTIPIVFALVIDPVVAGLVSDRQQPGGISPGLPASIRRK